MQSTGSQGEICFTTLPILFPGFLEILGTSAGNHLKHHELKLFFQRCLVLLKIWNCTCHDTGVFQCWPCLSSLSGHQDTRVTDFGRSRAAEQWAPFGARENLGALWFFMVDSEFTMFTTLNVIKEKNTLCGGFLKWRYP